MGQGKSPLPPDWQWRQLFLGLIFHPISDTPERKFILSLPFEVWLLVNQAQPLSQGSQTRGLSRNSQLCASRGCASSLLPEHQVGAQQGARDPR